MNSRRETTPSHSSALLSEATALLCAESKSQKDREILSLTKKYATCKSQLDVAVSRNVVNLESAQNMYLRVASNLATAKKKMESLKETLKSCRIWLRIEKPADFGKLYEENRELKYTLVLLEQADSFYQAFNAYKTKIFNHDYSGAAESLLLASSISENNPLFEDAPALKQLRDGLDKERCKLTSCILQSIRETIFMCKFPTRKTSVASIHPEPSRDIWVKMGQPQPTSVFEDDEQNKYEKCLRNLVKCYALHGSANDCYEEILNGLEADLLGLIEQIRRGDECSLRTDPDISDRIEIVKQNLTHFADMVRIFDIESSEIASRKFIESADREIVCVLAKYVNESKDTNCISDVPGEVINKCFLKRITIESSLFKFNRSSVFINRSV